ncbi:MAG: diguanylate cyclase [Methylophilaceae bacterium]|nr:diguanylate cyclase [Methylophilaceae bacterium]
MNEFEFTLSVSIGISIFNDHSKSKEDLLKQADTAMYEAKRLGKNNICIDDKSVKKHRKITKTSKFTRIN